MGRGWGATEVGAEVQEHGWVGVRHFPVVWVPLAGHWSEKEEGRLCPFLHTSTWRKRGWPLSLVNAASVYAVSFPRRTNEPERPLKAVNKSARGLLQSRVSQLPLIKGFVPSWPVVGCGPGRPRGGPHCACSHGAGILPGLSLLLEEKLGILGLVFSPTINPCSIPNPS